MKNNLCEKFIIIFHYVCHFINKHYLRVTFSKCFTLLCVHWINNIYFSDINYLFIDAIQHLFDARQYIVLICVLINKHYVKVSWTLCVDEWGISFSLTTSLPVHTGRKVTSRTRAEIVTILQCLVESVHLFVPSRGIDSLPVLVYNIYKWNKLFSN